MRFEFFFAARYLRAKRRQAVVGVVTAISVAGVAAGVAALIIALAITNGMQPRSPGPSPRLLRPRRAHARPGRRHPRLASPPRPPAPPPPRHRRRPRHLRSRSSSPTAPAPASRSSKASSPARSAPSAICSTPSPPAPPLRLNPGAQPTPTAGRRSVPALVLGSDLAEQIGVQVGDQRHGHQPTRRTHPVSAWSPISVLPRRRHLPFRLLSVRLKLGLHAPRRCAAPLR